MFSSLKRYLIKLLTDKLLYAVTLDDLLRIEPDALYVGQRKLDKEQVNELKSDAKNFEKSLLRKLMLNNIYWDANFKMVKGDNSEFGRGQVYGIEIINQFLEKLSLLR